MARPASPAMLAPTAPPAPAEDWRTLVSAVSGEGDDAVRVRLEINAEGTALRYAAEIDGAWRFADQPLAPVFARFITSHR